MREAVRDYVAAAVGEWPWLARCDISPAAADASDRLLRRFSCAATSQSTNSTLQQAMLSSVGRIRENRDIRIGLSRTHVNPLKWLGMAFLGFLTIVSIAIVHADAPVTALIAMSLFGLASAPTATIVLIHGNPFQPPSAVSPARIADALAGR
ncbi:MAG: DUF4239 domain-containing protein [Sphingomonadales bacterium]|nr:DUF4239 domain-containing protein [Sphingomonadales bacterium]MDE2567604.1 DUF4239 domain-containing protein [Sphingomonadales bacterium]